MLPTSAQPDLHHTGARLSSAQLGAILWLRWRIFANSFRRKGGIGELIGRILLTPLLAVLALLPALGACFFSWYLAMHGSLEHISWVLWAAFALTQLLNINLGQPGTTFDPTDLIRFPMSRRSYVLVRLSFGLLSPANLIMALMSLGVFIGITVDRPRLWPYTLLATTVFAITNVLFTRMVFAWVDRWLSTRRAREIFTAFIFAGSLLVQYLNVTYNPGFQHKRNRNQATLQNIQHAQSLAHTASTYGAWLPPELTGAAINAGARSAQAAFAADVVGCSFFGAAFFTIYTLRMRREYSGENLSDQANAVRSAPPLPIAAHATPSNSATAFRTATGADADPAVLAASPSETRARRPLMPATLAPLLGKELLILRRNTGLLYGIIAPTVMVFLFAGRISLRGNPHWLLLTAAAYALLGLAPMSYNSFGLEGPGAQFYFFAPVPLRDVFFAKNLMNFLLALFEVATVVTIVAYVSGRPSLLDCAFVLLWALATLLLNTTIGNLRSVSAPKKVNPGRSPNRAQSQVSAWIAIGILAACAALGFGCQLLAAFLHQPWVASTLAATLAAGSALLYNSGLSEIESYALHRRDSLFEELGKKT